MNVKASRRRVLRGMMNGAAVTVALPFLDCFLNSNGTACADGMPLPIRFGSWFWGLGMDHALFTPKSFGPNYELLGELASLKGYQQHVNIYSNFEIPTDGRPQLCHYTGWVALRTGEVPPDNFTLPCESIDTIVADVIGNATRFRSIQVAANGNPATSFSFRSADAVNPPDISANDLYARIFGPEFKDPNAPDFAPDPHVLMRKSALSVVLEQSAGLRRTLGAEDAARLDEYFTATRALEKRLALQSEKQPPTPACKVPTNPKELQSGIDADVLATRHALMVDLLVLALACNQTKVFNIAYSEAGAQTTRAGAPRPHHPQTHEEPKDIDLGYQPGAAWFVTRAMESWSYLVKALADFKEGDGTLLERSLVYAHSDSQLAQIHSLKGTPIMTAGAAGGRLKTGIHINGEGRPGTQVGLTALQAMGFKVNSWGANSLKTSDVISEVNV